MDRRWLIAAAAAVVIAGIALVVGLSGGDDKGDALDDALGYLPEDAPVAIAISTDLDSEAYQDLDVALQRFGVEGGVESSLGFFGGEEMFESLLGNDLVVGVPTGASVSEDGADPEFIAAIRVSDGDDVRSLLEDFGLEERDEIEGATVYGESEEDEEGEDFVETAIAVAVDDDTVIASESPAALEDALRQRAEDGRLTEETFEERLGDLPADGIVRAAGDVPSALESLGIEQVGTVPWIDSLESFGLSVSIDGRSLNVDSELRGEEVSEAELPLVPGPESPQVAPGEASIATLDQSQTLAFALDVAKAAAPQAALDAVIKRLETRLNGSVSALVDQFGSGLNAEIDRGSGEEPESVSRSEVKDPQAVGQALDALADQVPLLVSLQEGPAGDGLDAARFLVPALPLPEGGFYFEGSQVEPVSWRARPLPARSPRQSSRLRPRVPVRVLLRAARRGLRHRALPGGGARGRRAGADRP